MFRVTHLSSIFFPFSPDKKGEIKMAIGFVLMRVFPKRESEVFNKLSKLHEVIEIHQLFGEYDLIVKIESVGHESIGEIVIKKIRTIDGITDTQTLTAIGLG